MKKLTKNKIKSRLMSTIHINWWLKKIKKIFQKRGKF